MTRLGDVLEALVDCEHRTAPIDDTGGHFAVGTPAMQGNRIDYSEARRISAKTHSEWTRRMTPREGDILLAREAPVGPAVMIPPDENVAPGQRTVLMRVDATKHEPRFTFYALTAPATQALLHERAAGSTVAHLNVADIRAFEFPWGFPPKLQQFAIAEVLGALDDKIAANAQVSSSADALVRAMVDGLQGAEMSNVAALSTNPRIQASPPFEESAYVGLEHVPRRHMWMNDYGTPVALASGKFRFEPGDILFGKLRPYFHKVVVADRSGICSTDILVVRPRVKELAGFVWAVLSSDSVVERVSTMTEGTRMPRTNWADLAACEVPWPGDDEARRISDAVLALGSRAAAAQAESRHLAQLRDALLPHLMSGRITVRQAELLVEASGSR